LRTGNSGTQGRSPGRISIESGDSFAQLTDGGSIAVSAGHAFGPRSTGGSMHIASGKGVGGMDARGGHLSILSGAGQAIGGSLRLEAGDALGMNVSAS